MQISDEEKENLYKEFKERLKREGYTKPRNDILASVRNNHNERYINERFDDGREHHVTAYFNGWSHISQLVAKAYNVPEVSRIRGTAYESEAIEFAQRLSDLFFEYVWFNKKGDKL